MSEIAPDYFATWREAHDNAQARANALQLTYGIERQRVYGRECFRVFPLPKPQNRYGYELRVEEVKPTPRSDLCKCGHIEVCHSCEVANNKCGVRGCKCRNFRGEV